MGLKEFLGKIMEKKERFKEMQEEVRLQKILEDRQKSANERDLNTFLEEAREERIKKQLDKFRKKEKDKRFGSGILDKGNIFKGHKQILQAPNIFKIKTDFLQEGMFFK